ncbi:hypothetical protein G3480_00215 [Thiorhodococcus mannitoliphagus]|uniref:Uncharacterized protein n=1 Tax=Thiorhodococcus mannitoliphagus TaxID=329406 RepID=A0A6P1DLF4_9GAMM|nr:hypothetical protein [Thiorhodococcus mannitoliphagus]
MDHISVDLRGSEISDIKLEQGRFELTFSRAYLIKTMTGSLEKTRWWQAGALVIEEAELEGVAPGGPQRCAGGDIEDNIYTYRDMVPVPLESRGRVGCRLQLQGVAEPLIVSGTAIRLEMQDVPKYIEHIRPDA